jgi:hypothetical protein
MDGPFEQVLLETTSETSANASVADLDGDGDLDIVLAKGRHWPLQNRVLISDGRGGFTARDLGAGPDRTYSGGLADLDADGDLGATRPGPRATPPRRISTVTASRTSSPRIACPPASFA